MDTLFSCNNCLMNPVQYGSLGSRTGYCILHQTVLQTSCATTCHFLQRKDLPTFVLKDAHAEHRREYPDRDALVQLDTKRAVAKKLYSEKYHWAHRSFDADLHFAALYSRTGTKWQLIQTLAGADDAVRTMMHSVMVRRYMLNCGKWTSSYRLMLAVANEIDVVPVIKQQSFWIEFPPERFESLSENAQWDVMMLRISTIQEFGGSASVDELMWLTDRLGEVLAEAQPALLSAKLAELKPSIITRIINLAKSTGCYFQ